MVEFEITDPDLRQSVLLFWVRQISRRPDYAARLMSQGASAQLIDYLRTRATLAEIAGVMHLGQPAFSLKFDDRALMACVEQRQRFLRDDMVKEYLARNGASTELLAAWFNLPRTEADAYRAAYGQTGLAGRPRLPPIETRDRIHQAWALLPRDRERDAYYDLHKLFPNVTVATLYRVIHEHEDVCARAATTPKVAL